MTAQIIERAGKKKFAVIPYKQFVRMQEALEDYHALKALRRAKSDPKNQRGRPFADVAQELGLLKKARSGGKSMCRNSTKRVIPSGAKTERWGQRDRGISAVPSSSAHDRTAEVPRLRSIPPPPARNSLGMTRSLNLGTPSKASRVSPSPRPPRPPAPR